MCRSSGYHDPMESCSVHARVAQSVQMYTFVAAFLISHSQTCCDELPKLRIADDAETPQPKTGRYQDMVAVATRRVNSTHISKPHVAFEV